MNQQPDNQTSPKALLAIGLCVLFYIGWNQYLSKQYPGWNEPPVQTDAPTTGSSNNSQSTTGSTSSPSTSPDSTSPISEKETVAQLPEEQLRIETDSNVYEFDQSTGAISSIILKNYMDRKGEGAKPVELAGDPFYIQAQTQNTSIAGADGPFHGARDGNSIKFWRQEGDWRLEQIYTVHKEGSGMDVTLNYENTAPKSQNLIASLLMRTVIPYAKSEGSFLPGASQARPSYIYNVAGDTEWEDIEGHCNDADATVITGAQNQPVGFFGLDSHYFLSVLMPKSKVHSFTLHKGRVTDKDCDVAIISYEDWGSVKSGETVTMAFDGYFGPKVLEALEKENPRLEATIDFGFFSFIAKPLLLAVQGFYNLTGNYGWSIVIMTLLLKFLFYPLMKASSTSMHKLKKLNPQMAEIREKFKDDRQRQQQEMMKFMTANKVNPMKGCFPILPQIPVFFAFWQVLRTSIDLRHAEFFGWINDLTAPDAFYITPILMGVAMFAQQKLTPTTGMDKTQEKIMMFIPIMFTVPMLTFPAGMTVYMLTNTLTSIAQQRWLYYKLDKQQEEEQAQ